MFENLKISKNRISRIEPHVPENHMLATTIISFLLILYEKS